jgi:hypothetical protein
MRSQFFDSRFELRNFRTFFTDDDTWPRGVDTEPYSSGGPLNLDSGNTGVI